MSLISNDFGRSMKKIESETLVKVSVDYLLNKLKENSGRGEVTLYDKNNSFSKVRAIYKRYSSPKRIQFYLYDHDEVTEGDIIAEWSVNLLTTPCNFGGFRPWFECPHFGKNEECLWRVGFLYKDGDWLGCRGCGDITYESRNENKKNRSYYTFKVLDLKERIEKLESSISHPTYNGQPTRKVLKLRKLKAELQHVGKLFRRAHSGIEFTNGRSF